MKKRTKRVLFLSLAGLIVGAAAVTFWAAQTCTEYYWNFTENFSGIEHKDVGETTVANWPPAPIRLPFLGADFAMTKPNGMGGRIYVCDKGDFDGDGYPDLVGLQLTGPLSNINATSRLVLIRNIYPTTLSSSNAFSIDATEVYDNFSSYTAPASICTGDFNGDGLMDFFFMKNSADSLTTFSGYVAAMYINRGTASNPDFAGSSVAVDRYKQSPNLDFSSKFQSAGIGLTWVANHCVAADIDKDGDQDILIISGSKIYLARNPGAGNFNVASWEVGELNYDQPTGFTADLVVGYTYRGGTAIAAADFDNDGDIDIVAGAVNDYDFLAYYENDGMGFFTRKELVIPNENCTGTVALLAEDFTGDGRKDIVGATDAWNAGNQARIWLFKNDGLVEKTILNELGEEVVVKELDWTFKCQNACNPVNPDEYDVDFAAALDYDKDGDIDFVEADANHSGDYYLVINQIASVYALLGQAVSNNLTQTAIDHDEYAITAVRVTQLSQRVQGTSTGLTVSLYFSNNNGQNWELYRTFTGSAITNFSDSTAYTFKNFGADLKWKIVMTAPEDAMAEYDDASYDTPEVSQLSIEVTYVAKQEYSRSSAAATIVTKEGARKKIVVSSSFIFPGWEGHLRAYDVTDMSLNSGSYSYLSAVSSSNLGSSTGRDLASGVEIYWDAGELLNSRSPASRTIYTATRAGGSTTMPLVRQDFTEGNVNTLRSFLADTQNDPSGLIQFIRGVGRDWKLGDINHSTPTVVGPPSEAPDYMGTGYSAFAALYENRRKVVYIGANDGMLHCFDASTGEELWGFIPYNLLLKLKNMWAVDSANNTRYFTHDVYVDGTPSVADVKINGAWRTVLVCGQGAGKGSTLAGGGANYYFALDITDPENPIPLWEFTHTYTSGSGRNKKTYQTTGETWSVPVFGRLNDGSGTWAVFMGSGYDNTSTNTAGNRFYAVRAATGESIKDYQVANVNTYSVLSSSYRYADIKATIPGSPSAVDFNKDGYTDYVYYGDLDGRLWRLDVTPSSPSAWKNEAVYTDRYYYPIITKPAVWINPNSGSTYPYIFFGTGGDDNAPANRIYSFVCVREGSASVEPMWYMGSESTTPSAVFTLAKCAGTLETGEKIWADPVISDSIVYFSTLKGNIEQVNPCLNIGEAGDLYARFVTNMSGSLMGSTALRAQAGGALEKLQLVSKARQAVTVGEVQRSSGATYKREVYIQEYDSTLERLEQAVASILKIKSWREIYQIFK